MGVILGCFQKPDCRFFEHSVDVERSLFLKIGFGRGVQIGAKLGLQRAAIPQKWAFCRRRTLTFFKNINFTKQIATFLAVWDANRSRVGDRLLGKIYARMGPAPKPPNGTGSKLFMRTSDRYQIVSESHRIGIGSGSDRIASGSDRIRMGSDWDGFYAFFLVLSKAWLEQVWRFWAPNSPQTQFSGTPRAIVNPTWFFPILKHSF